MQQGPHINEAVINYPKISYSKNSEIENFTAQRVLLLYYFSDKTTT